MLQRGRVELTRAALGTGDAGADGGDEGFQEHWVEFDGLCTDWMARNTARELAFLTATSLATMFGSTADVAALAAPAEGSIKEYWHATQQGFGVRLRSNGERVHLARHMRGGKEVRVGLGNVDGADALSYEAATQLAKQKAGAAHTAE